MRAIYEYDLNILFIAFKEENIAIYIYKTFEEFGERRNFSFKINLLSINYNVILFMETTIYATKTDSKVTWL